MDLLREHKKNIIIQVVSDVLIIGAGGIVLLLFRFLLSPFKRGFFCDDQSLMYPFKESTVPSSIMYSVGFILALVLVCAVESLRVYKARRYDLKSSENHIPLPRLWLFVYNAYTAFVPFVYGAVIEHIVTDIGKYAVGRLRPHFFDVCKVDFSSVDCSSGYIEDFTCTGTDSNRIREMRLSFPSGHSSFSSYVAVYLIIYAQRRARFFVRLLIRPLVQALLFCSALYICLSRISDYKHHPTDVMAGALIGSVVAALIAYNVSDLFNEEKKGKSYHGDDVNGLEETPKTSTL